MTATGPSEAAAARRLIEHGPNEPVRVPESYLFLLAIAVVTHLVLVELVEQRVVARLRMRREVP